MINFTYRLTGPGWAEATVANEQNGTTIMASYITDALADFIDALVRLLAEATAQCYWEEEPAVIRWEFRRDGNKLTVKVYRDCDSRGIFAGEDQFLHFCSELDRALDALLAEWGLEGYLKKWDYPFPQEAHAKLKQIIRLEGESRQLRG